MQRILLATLAAATLAAATSARAGEDDMETARVFLDSGLYGEAAYYLRAAADVGDAQAAEILGFMHSFGPEMFPGVQRDPVAAARWFELAALGGRPVGRYLACARVTQPARRCLEAAAGTP